MERIREIMEEKYYWRPEYKLALAWADLALYEGASSLVAVDYIIEKLFEKVQP